MIARMRLATYFFVWLGRADALPIQRLVNPARSFCMQQGAVLRYASLYAANPYLLSM